MTTTIWAAMDGLVAALRVSAELAALACPIDLGFPSKGPQRPRHVWVPAEVDDLTTVADVSGAAGVGVFEETYRLRVYMVAVVPGDRTFAEWRHKIEELADPVLTAIRTDQTLGGAVSLATPGQLSIGESWPSETERSLDAVLWVDVQSFVC